MLGGLMGEGRGEGSPISSPPPSNPSQSSSSSSHLPASPGLPGEVSASSQTEGVFSSPQLTESLLEDLLNPAMTPILICQIHTLTLPQLTTIIQGQDYQSAITAIETINAARTPTIESQTHLQTLAVLKETIDLTQVATTQAAKTLPSSSLPSSPGLPGEVSRSDGGGLSYSSHLRLQHNLLESLRKSTTTLLKAVRPQSPQQPPTPPHWAPKNSASNAQSATHPHSAAAPLCRGVAHTNHDPKSHQPTPHPHRRWSECADPAPHRSTHAHQPGALTRRLRRSEATSVYTTDPDAPKRASWGTRLWLEDTTAPKRRVVAPHDQRPEGG